MSIHIRAREGQYDQTPKYRELQKQLSTKLGSKHGSQDETQSKLAHLLAGGSQPGFFIRKIVCASS